MVKLLTLKSFKGILVLFKYTHSMLMYPIKMFISYYMFRSMRLKSKRVCEETQDLPVKCILHNHCDNSVFSCSLDLM